MKDPLSDLSKKVRELMNNREIREQVDKRIKEFREIKRRGCDHLFSELSFCILTANYSAEGGIRIQREIGIEGFLNYTEDKLAIELRRLGHRYPRMRAKYIALARNKKEILCKKVMESDEDKAYYLREWLVNNIKGIGYKEASHFLRNIGFFSLAIIDYHIIDLMVKEGVLKEKPRSLKRKDYLKIESIIKKLAQKTGLEPGVLDLYLWYMETGKILK